MPTNNAGKGHLGKSEERYASGWVEEEPPPTFQNTPPPLEEVFLIMHESVPQWTLKKFRVKRCLNPFFFLLFEWKTKRMSKFICGEKHFLFISFIFCLDCGFFFFFDYRFSFCECCPKKKTCFHGLLFSLLSLFCLKKWYKISKLYLICDPLCILYEKRGSTQAP